MLNAGLRGFRLTGFCVWLLTFYVYVCHWVGNETLYLRWKCIFCVFLVGLCDWLFGVYVFFNVLVYYDDNKDGAYFCKYGMGVVHGVCILCVCYKNNLMCIFWFGNSNVSIEKMYVLFTHVWGFYVRKSTRFSFSKVTNNSLLKIK